MGSWHGTCGVTGLPLRCDDPVRVALLAFDAEPPVGWRSGFCHPSDIAFPITPLVPGTYDDYGGAMFGALDEPMHYAMHHRLMPTPNEPGDLQDVLRENDLKFRSFNGVSRVGLFMVREDIYQHMLHEIVDRDRGGRGIRTFAEFRAAADVLVQDLIDLSAKMRDADDTRRARYRFLSETYWSRWELDVGKQREHDLRREFEFATVNFRQGMGVLNDRLTDLAATSNATAETLQPFAYAIADMLKFEHAMQTLRRSYSPPTGAGSSSENRIAHRSLAKLTLTALDAMDERDREEFGDEEFEDEESDKTA